MEQKPNKVQTIIFDEIHHVFESPNRDHLERCIVTAIKQSNTIMLSGTISHIDELINLHESEIPIIISENITGYQPVIIHYNPRDRYIEEVIKQIYYLVRDTDEIAVIFVEVVKDIIEIIDIIRTVNPLPIETVVDVPPIAYWQGSAKQKKVLNNIYKWKIGIYYRNIGKLYTHYLEKELYKKNRAINFMIITTSGAEGIHIPNILYIVKFKGTRNYFNTQKIIDQIIHRGSRDRVSITYIPNNPISQLDISVVDTSNR
jgi:hypothetical protein